MTEDKANTARTFLLTAAEAARVERLAKEKGGTVAKAVEQVRSERCGPAAEHEFLVRLATTYGVEVPAEPDVEEGE